MLTGLAAGHWVDWECSSEGRSNFHGFLGTLHGQRAADGRSKSVAAQLRAVSTNGNFHGFLGTLHGQRAADGRSESVAARLRAISTNRKNSKCQIFSQTQKLGYLGSCWMELHQILTQYSLKVGLWMVQAPRDDVKDFCWILTFSDWAKIGDFRTFFGRKTLFSGIQMFIK